MVQMDLVVDMAAVEEQCSGHQGVREAIQMQVRLELDQCLLLPAIRLGAEPLLRPHPLVVVWINLHYPLPATHSEARRKQLHRPLALVRPL